jgi:nucleotide-binding universal stress UspA family protein
MTSDSRGIRKFLVCVDDTPECRVALHFACRRAKKTGGGVTLLRVIEPADFQHWVAVEDLMREEARAAAEALLQELAAGVNEWADLMPELMVREGPKRDAVLTLIEEDPAIRILVLGAASGPGGPGPLVNALASQMAGTMRVPVTIVPGTLSNAQIDELT